MDFKEKELHDDMYWKYVFMTKMFIIRLETVTYGIRDGRSISFADYSSLEMKYPDVREQAAIGQYFQTLDKQLRLYEQKLSKLKNLKSAFLKNMFV
jgi:type I restriction enzyme S subunit